MKNRLGRRKPKAKIRLGGDPILNVVCKPVRFNEDISKILLDMRYIIFTDIDAVGISAPQVGYTKQVIMVKEQNCNFVVMINPKIRQVSTENEEPYEEGCLSYPGIFKVIQRFSWISVDYRTEHGKKMVDIVKQGSVARIIQHEIDHLNGKCLVGKLNI